MGDRLPTLTVVGVGPKSTRLEVHYSFSAQPVEVVQPRLRLVSEIFVAAGARGAFKAAPLQTPHSRLTLDADIAPGPEEVVHQLSCDCLDVRAFQCLRSMVRRLRHDGIVVQRLVVVDPKRSTDEGVHLDWPTEQNENVVYPDVSPRIRALLVWEDSDFGKSRRCLVEALQPLKPGAVMEFESWMRPWYQLVEAGAYSMPVGLPEETECIAGSVNQFDENTIEIGLDRFYASERAWDVLANMTDTFWAPSASLRRIVVD